MAGFVSQTLAIINDNDFDLSGAFDAATGLMPPSKAPDVPTLGIIHLSPAL
jgi:hypothetical protein